MSSKFQIAIVDDEPTNCRLLEKSLAEKYDLQTFYSGSECLKHIEDNPPNAFLLDVRMPEMDGFELCQKIKSIPMFANTYVIFLSALDSLEKKLQGYEAGADDYITKPIEIDELDAKLSRALSRSVSAEEAKQDAISMAMTALQNGSEIGIVNQFLEKLTESTDYKSLAKNSLASIQQFDINAIIQLRVHSEHIITQSSSEPANPLEEELMLLACNTKRIHSFGNRCMFNFQNASLLVRKMPEDLDKAGRLRDHLASIMNGVEARMQGLKIEQSLKQQKKVRAIDTLNETQQSLTEILDNFKGHESNIVNIIQNLLDEMNLAFSYLELNEEQEEYLTEIFNRSMGRITRLFSNSVALDRKFENVIKDLHKIINEN